MTSHAAISGAIALPCGARFYRCAFQVNPPHYTLPPIAVPIMQFRAGIHRRTGAKCTELGVQVLAVTDHNHVGSIDAIRKKANENGSRYSPDLKRLRRRVSISSAYTRRNLGRIA